VKVVAADVVDVGADCRPAYRTFPPGGHGRPFLGAHGQGGREADGQEPGQAFQAADTSRSY